jgi:hypothetical protein
MVFWITSHMKTKREQVDDKLMVIKLFSCNYARDLISIDIKEKITTMEHLFVSESIVKPYILTTDSTLIKAHGKIWHKSSIEKGIVPCRGIDTNARWGYSHTKGWIFRYKPHTWYQILVILLYPYLLLMLQLPMYRIIKFIQD